jgi:hypothetical protein
MILALDLGGRTGWALWEEDGRVESGVQVFDLMRGESPGMRFVRFNGWLSSWVADDHRPALVAYERPHHGGATTHVAAGFATRIQEFCARNGIEHAAVHSAALKRWPTGTVNAVKRAKLAAVAQRWKAAEDDHEANAIALLHYVLGEFVLPVMVGW